MLKTISNVKNGVTYPVPLGDDLKPDRGGRKNNGKKGKKKEIYEWDHTHDDIEVYNGKGKHKGSMTERDGICYPVSNVLNYSKKNGVWSCNVTLLRQP